MHCFCFPDFLKPGCNSRAADSNRLPRPTANPNAQTMSEAASPLARPFPAMPPIGGVTLRVARAGYKDWGRCDLTYVELAEGTAVAGVFTRNVCCSSEVDLGRANLGQG